MGNKFYNFKIKKCDQFNKFSPIPIQLLPQYRQPKEQQKRQQAAVSEFALDLPGGHNFTDFDAKPNYNSSKSTPLSASAAFHQHFYFQPQPMSYPNHPQPLQPLHQSVVFDLLKRENIKK